MAAVDNESIVPQWKKDLIMRRRSTGSKNHPASSIGGGEQLSSVLRSPASGASAIAASVSVGCAGHQPTATSSVSGSVSAVCASDSSCGQTCVKDCGSSTCFLRKMVQERTWVDHKQISVDMVPETIINEKSGVDSDSSEELQYGPGIVSKLKNRYLSLTLREASQKSRPTILHMRKAASLENMLDDDHPIEEENNRKFESRMNGNAKNVPNRYRNPVRGSEMKRARSVETISSTRTNEPNNITTTAERPKSLLLHEDVFIIDKEATDKPYRKSPDSSNQLFEPAENKYTSRVNRPKRIAPVMNEKEKPPADVVKQAKKIFETRPECRTKPPQHTGDVAAKVANFKSIIIQTKASTKPTLKQKPQVDKRKPPPPARLPITKPSTPPPKKPLPSPIPDVSMTNAEQTDNPENTSSLTQTPDLILHSSPIHAKPSTPPPQQADLEEETHKTISPESQRNISNASNSITFNFIKPTPATQPLKLEIEPVHHPQTEKRFKLSPREIEKNFINASKSNQQKPPVPAQQVIIREDTVAPTAVVSAAPAKCEPKLKRAARPKQDDQQNCIVFKFTDRKDVPDYVGNDGTIRTGKIEKPKTGEGGITILPGASIDEAFVDYEEELRSLEGPPSPCDVSFINDNILIDGRSSLSQKTKKPKMRIQFVEAVPQIFVYPSEAAMLLLEQQDVQSPTAIGTMGHTVPSLTGKYIHLERSKSALDQF